MTFDDQIRRTLDSLADRLRAEVARQVGGAVDGLAASAQADREAAIAQAVAEALGKAEQEASVRVKDAVSTAEQRAREAAEQTASARLTDAVSAAEQRAREAAEQKASARLTEAVSTAEQRSRDAAQQNARGAADAAVASARAELNAANRATGERLVDALRAIDRARSLSEILDTLATTAGREAARVGILLVRGEQLHGWRFVGFGPAFETASETTLSLRDAGLIGDAVGAGVAVSSDTSGRRAAPPFAQLPDGREALAVPIPMDGQIVSVLYADQGSADTGSRPSAITWRSALEVMARHAARCLEAVTAFRTARVLTERPDVAPAASNGARGAVEPPAAGRRADEATDEGSESARRYARLLVSEIKLYHEAAVVAGQRERDLATRLADEIARARVLYEQRVAAHHRQGADYFHAELVRTLANGDASLLGVSSQ